MKMLALIACCLFGHDCLAQDALFVAYVRTQQDQWQLIDRAGKVLADSLFEHGEQAVLNCGEGMAVTERNHKYGFVDLNTRRAIENVYDSVGTFRQGNTAARINGQWHRLARSGSLEDKVLDARLVSYYTRPGDSAATCEHGYCLVETDSFINCKGPDGRLLLAGSDVFVAPWNDVNSFISDRILKYKVMANKICSCHKMTSYYGFIDRKGAWVIEPDYEQADIFSCGLAAVGKGFEEVYAYGYLGMDGQWVIKPVYREAGRFMRIETVR